jgi:DNA topoisomerase-6 subunit B
MAKALLERTTFHTSRVVEFFTEHELQRHIGFGKALWALALLKELIDNALDACEAAGVAPELEVVVEADAVTVRDNGPGLPRAMLERSLDYLVRVSNKSYYVSPTRGRLGNALKCVWATPYVVDGAQGHVEVTTGGMTHHITVTLNRIAQRPVVQHTVSADGFVTNGTCITMYWPEIAGLAQTCRQWHDVHFLQYRGAAPVLCSPESSRHTAIHGS